MKLILVELNEINFDAVEHYINKGVSLPNFKYIIDKGMLTTFAEERYENLEPWIQWPSVHTGKTYEEHKVFRLGDFVNSKEEQFFEKVENAGYSVGAISPMNAANNLKDPKYFIPDPWTQTPSDTSFLGRIVTSAVSQAVNENSQKKLTFKTLISLVIAFIMLVSPTRFYRMSKYALSSLGKPWRKALFLDMFLHEVHKTLYKKNNVNFSTLFLNAGAHIQHHYFYNSDFVNSKILKNPKWYIDSNQDPFLEMLKVYDQILGDLLTVPSTELIIATGLSQKPFDELKFYYRLNNHSNFLKDIGISFKSVFPRMTRDFLVTFDTDQEAKIASDKLSTILVNGDKKLFGEIDNRGSELFVILTYPDEILPNTTINIISEDILLQKYVTFVAIKNGEHQSKGFAYFSDGILDFAPSNNSNISNIHYSVLNFFDIKT